MEICVAAREQGDPRIPVRSIQHPPVPHVQAVRLGVLVLLALAGVAPAGETNLPARPALASHLKLMEQASRLATTNCTGPVADNSRCFVCHINYEQDYLALRHAKATIGCVNCHGECLAHAGDEDHLTPAEVMIARDRVEAFCTTKCHPLDKLAYSIHWPAIVLAKERRLCTECHGQHRLVRRARVWDKDTGKLIAAEGGPVKPPSRTETPASDSSSSGEMH